MSALRCRTGDLAVIVKSAAGNEGRVVKCLRLATAQEVANEKMYWRGYVWVTDSVLNVTYGSPTKLYPDERMRPIRDSDGEDEMLRIAGKPQEMESVK